MKPDVLNQLAEKSISKKELFRTVENDFTLLPLLAEGVGSQKASIRYGCSSVLVDLSAKYPEKLYPQMDFFVSLLGNKRRILVWNGMAAVANLCAVDAEKKFDAIIDKYFGFLGDEYMVTVANVVGNSARIALAKPYLVPRITIELLQVDEIQTSPHLTEECKKVIAEHAVKSFDQFFNLMGAQEKARVMAFVKKHAHSSRVPLQKEAERFLKRHAS